MQKFNQPKMAIRTENNVFEVIFILDDVTLNEAFLWAKDPNEIRLITQVIPEVVTEINIYKNNADIKSYTVVFTFS